MIGKPNVYIVQALGFHGGSYMIYHLGLILNRVFGLEVVVLGGAPERGSPFHYPVSFETRPLAEMDRCVRAEDVLVCGPSFAEHYFGLRVPGRKLMYAQGFNTFSVLDGFFDRYVAVSPFVRKYLREVYGIESGLIPPFLFDHPEAGALPWAQREPLSLAIRLKGEHRLQLPLLNRLRENLRRIAPALEAAIPWDKALAEAAVARSHDEMLRYLGSKRYVLTLSVAEGFGLVPLEAMRMGACVMGLDGFGGRAYMRADNGRFAAYPRLDLLAGEMAEVFSDDALAARLAAAGRNTAQEYTYERFLAAWTEEFQRFGLETATGVTHGDKWG